jgi:LAO/AO transport system kinase
VLAVDPSSSLSGGSILGDKTRMTRLANTEHAFVRPSPAAGSLGGVAFKTREAIGVVEAAGFDVVLVETVGVGQSEIEVAGMTDFFLLLQAPHAGDELQALKKGIVEWADMVVINKSDLDPIAAAHAQSQFKSTVGLTHRSSGEWVPPVITLSAIQSEGLDLLWQTVLRFRQQQSEQGLWEARRQDQQLAWMEALISQALRERFDQHPWVREHLESMREAVKNGRITPSQAAQKLIERSE